MSTTDSSERLRIHVYSICWNEEMMLPHFLEYYSSFADQIIVYDNFSTDRSLEICSQFPKVHTKSYFTNNQIRDDIYLQIKNQAWKQSRGEADFVIVCDVDEWIFHPDLKTFLVNAKRSGITAFNCVGYNMISDFTPGSEHSLLRDIREGVRAPNFDKMAVFDPNSLDEINYEFGAHTALPVGSLNIDRTGLQLLHYKYMGLEYMVSRYQKMAERISAYNKKLNLGHHYFFTSRKIRREFNGYWTARQKVI